MDTFERGSFGKGAGVRKVEQTYSVFASPAILLRRFAQRPSLFVS